MYSKRFDYIVAKTLNFEGGFQNFANDSANYTRSGKLVGTNRGISAIAYEQYLGKEPTVADIKAITPEIAKAVYYKLFWLPMQGDQLKNDGVAWVIFDSYIATGNLKTARKGINLGLGKKVIQETAVPFNTFTVNAVNKGDSATLIKSVVKANVEQRKAIGNEDFIDGWINRLTKLQDNALQLVKNPITVIISTLVGLFFLVKTVQYINKARG